MRRVLALAVVLGCTGKAVETDETDAPELRLDCLSWSASMVSLETDRGDTVNEVVTLANDCARDLDVSVTLGGHAQLFAVTPAEASLSAGGDLQVTVTFSPDVSGDKSTTLTADSTSSDAASIEVAGHARGAEYSLAVPSDALPPLCPTPVPLTITNIGDGDGEIVVLGVTGTDVTVEADTPALPVIVPPAGTLRFDVVATLPVEAVGPALRVELIDQRIGSVELVEPLELDGAALRSERFEAWSFGRPVDVILTVDRSMSESDWRTGVEEGMVALLDTLADDSRDYKVIGLVDPSGCPLGRQEPVGRLESATEGAKRLVGMLDLDNARGVDRSLEHKPFTLIENGLLPENTRPGGCNEWRRGHAPLVTLHITDEDDQSDMTPAEHVSRLRSVVALDDRVSIYAIAGPPGGCETAAEGVRLDAASVSTGGQLRALCGAEWDRAFSAAAQIPGDPQRVPLETAPYEPSLYVIPDGLEGVKASWDGEAVVVPKSIDREEEGFEARYVSSEACD